MLGGGPVYDGWLEPGDSMARRYPVTASRVGCQRIKEEIDMTRAWSDGDREVEFEEEPLLPDQTRDDTDAGWGERGRWDDDWLREERPPHWDR